jgi:hypothetical protein
VLLIGSRTECESMTTRRVSNQRERTPLALRVAPQSRVSCRGIKRPKI